jgi:hypothetical protein
MGPSCYGCLHAICCNNSKSPFRRLGYFLKIFNRGLYALILTFIFQSQLVAEYLYKDEVVHRPLFQEQVEVLGKELHEKTGIRLLLIMLKELPHGVSIFQYEKDVLSKFQEPTIVLTFSEMNSEIDIEVNDPSLYKYFKKEQVLSPAASLVQAFTLALVYAENYEDFKKLISNYGGTILPLIAGKAKNEQIVGKYAASMFNGYLDIAQQIAKSKNIILENDAGDSNQKTLFYIKIFFYSFVLYAIVMIIRRKIYKRKHKKS